MRMSEHYPYCKPYEFVGSNMPVTCLECSDHVHTPEEVNTIEIQEFRPPTVLMNDRYKPIPRFYCPKHSHTHRWLCQRVWVEMVI